MRWGWGVKSKLVGGGLEVDVGEVMMLTTIALLFGLRQ